MKSGILVPLATARGSVPLGYDSVALLFRQKPGAQNSSVCRLKRSGQRRDSLAHSSSRQSIWFLDRNTSLQFKAELPAAQELLRIIFFARASGSFRKAGFIFPNLAPYSFDEQHASAKNPVDTYAPSEAFVRNSEEGIHYSEKVALPRPEDQMVFLNLLGSIRLGYQLDKFF